MFPQVIVNPKIKELGKLVKKLGFLIVKFKVRLPKIRSVLACRVICSFAIPYQLLILHHNEQTYHFFFGKR